MSKEEKENMVNARKRKSMERLNEFMTKEMYKVKVEISDFKSELNQDFFPYPERWKIILRWKTLMRMVLKG